MKQEAYLIRYEMSAPLNGNGSIRCNHISDFPTLCFKDTDGSFYPHRKTAEDFLFKFEQYYKGSIKFKIIKVLMEFTETGGAK